MFPGAYGTFNFWRCYKIMPLVYDESLSYYEVLCKLTQKINEVIESIQNDDTEIYNYINQQDQLMLQNAKNYTDEKVANVELALGQAILTLTELIKNTDSSTRVWVTGQINELTDWLEKQGTTIYVKSPITGYTDTVQNVLDQMYNLFNYFGITCIEYDNSNITCEEYDNKNLTCEMYDLWARKYLWKDPKFYMFHPVTGERVFYKNVISFLVELHRTNGVTCTEYDEQNITCENYDLFNMSAYEYDWNAKEHFQMI